MLLVTQLLIGSAIGLVITTTGVGGGVILLPVLIYLFGMNALAAVATANLLSMLMKVSSSYIHFRLGNIPLKPALLILGIMFPATFLASYGVTWLGSQPQYYQQVELGINILMIVAIIFSMFLFLQRIFKKSTSSHPLSSLAPSSSIPLSSLFVPGPLSSLFVPGMSAGFVLGATGVGGGLVVLPVLMRFAQMNIKEAIGSSIFITTILSGGSAIAYSAGGYTDVHTAIILCLGSLISIPLARYLLVYLSERFFQYLTLLFILISIIMMSWKLIN